MMPIKETLRIAIKLHLHQNGPCGGENLRKAIGRKYLVKGEVFGRSLFSTIMRELVADGLVRDDEKNYRHKFTLI